MPVIWDDAKGKRNLEKHGIRFSDAALVLEDPYALTITDDESSQTEQRFATMGADALGRVLVVVYAYRGEDIRLISARPAAPHERKEYENR